MKKKSLLSVMFASVGVMLGFSSCNKCVECTRTYGTYTYKNTMCKPENYTAKAWKNLLDEAEDNGATCENL